MRFCIFIKKLSLWTNESLNLTPLTLLEAASWVTILKCLLVSAYQRAIFGQNIRVFHEKMRFYFFTKKSKSVA
jgi:hypothetical protein